MYINLQQSYDEMSVLRITHNNFTWRYRIKGETITCNIIIIKVVLYFLFGLLCFVVSTMYLIITMESAHLICKFAIHHDWLDNTYLFLTYIHTMYIHTMLCISVDIHYCLIHFIWMGSREWYCGSAPECFTWNQHVYRWYDRLHPGQHNTR